MAPGAPVIRLLEERPDASAVLAEWFMAEWPDYHRNRSLADVASRFRLSPQGQETLIAELDGELVGTVAIRGTWETAPEIPPPWIGGLFVAPEHRGRGIGMALIDAAVRAVAARGDDTVHMAIRVDPSSFEQRGWRIVGTVFAGDDQVTVVRRSTG